MSPACVSCECETVARGAQEPNPLTPFPYKEGGTESRGQPLHPSQDAGSVVASG